MNLGLMTMAAMAAALLVIGCTHDSSVPGNGGNGGGGGGAGGGVGGGGGGGGIGGGGGGGGNTAQCPSAQVEGLPDWSKAGYRGGQPLPDASKVSATVDVTKFGVVADDGKDDSAALQAAIDSIPANGRDFDHFTVVQLPPGQILLSEQIAVDKSFVILRGAGSDPTTGTSTRIVVRPSLNLRWDVLENVDATGNATAALDGDLPGLDIIQQGSAKGGWVWPGRGTFRAQTRQVHAAYASEYQAAPANRKDLFEGTINAHWKVGLAVDQSSPIVAKLGNTQIKLTVVTGLQVGQPVQVLDANSIKMYRDTGVVSPDFHTGVPYNRMQVFTVTAISGKTITLDKPLEFDLVANDTADGSPALSGAPILSKVVPLTVVQGIGFESFYLTYDLNGLPKLSGGTYALTRAQAKDDYGNFAPEYALHGIVLKWVTDSWVKNVQTEMTGSHPIVTEVARHLTIEGNTLTGAYNKGKGGNGYFRGSRLWDSLIRGNVLRELRHLTMQWSSSGNVIVDNDMDNDMNFHGGWERNNLVEHNTIKVGYDHRPGRCTVHCGSEGGASDTGQWYPIWWGAGAKAQKWSGATGPRNVLFDNIVQKQLDPSGPFLPFAHYDGTDCPHRVTQLGWSRDSGGGYQHLATSAGLIADWAGNESVDFTTAPNLGVDADFAFAGASIYAGH